MVDRDELPDTVRAGLDGFIAAALEVFADNLVSVVLYGSAAEGRLRATSDVNLIVVLRQVEPAALEAIGPAYRMAHATLRLAAMFILESEIALASDAFVVKFFDVSTRHRVLFGRDPFADLVVDRESAKRRLRQILINLTLRLREHVALSGAFPEQLALAAADAVGPLRACAAMLVSLETGTNVPPRDALYAFAERGGQVEGLNAMTQARETGGIPAAGASRAIEAAFALATLLAAQAESLD
jgi:predicted nucleotidyltransferase